MQDPSAASGGNAGLHPFHTPTAACANSGSSGPPAPLVFPTTALQGVCIDTFLGSGLDVPGGWWPRPSFQRASLTHPLGVNFLRSIWLPLLTPLIAME